MSKSFAVDVYKRQDGNILDPGGNATRAEVATMLMRYIENVMDPDSDTQE